MEQLQTDNTMLRVRVLQLQQKLDDADEDEDAEGEAGQGEIENGDAGTDAELTQQTALVEGHRRRKYVRKKRYSVTYKKSSGSGAPCGLSTFE